MTTLDIIARPVAPTSPIDDLLMGAASSYLAGKSAKTRAAYESRIHAFMDWRADLPADLKMVEQVGLYLTYLRDDRKLAARSVQGHINVLKAWLKSAVAFHPELWALAAQLDMIKPPKVIGTHQGVRLTAEEAQALLDAPDRTTAKGLRDAAMLTLMLTLGMRRSEVCNLTFGHLQMMEGVMVIANLRGKHGRVRTMKLLPSVHRLIMAWAAAAALDPTDPEQPVFVPLSKRGVPLNRNQALGTHALYKMLELYVEKTGITPVKPHDLRRTAASLARKNGARIEQVQVMLGHENPQTTSHYIGEGLDLHDHAVNYSPLKIAGEL